MEKGGVHGESCVAMAERDLPRAAAELQTSVGASCAGSRRPDRLHPGPGDRESKSSCLSMDPGQRPLASGDDVPAAHGAGCSARQMPKRGKGGTLHSRQALLHAATHIENWAVDLSWDVVARFGLRCDEYALPKAFFDDFVTVGFGNRLAGCPLHRRRTPKSAPCSAHGPGTDKPWLHTDGLTRRRWLTSWLRVQPSVDAHNMYVLICFLGKPFPTDLSQVAEDECRHFVALAKRLEELGSSYGAYPVHDGCEPATLIECVNDVLDARNCCLRELQPTPPCRPPLLSCRRLALATLLRMTGGPSPVPRLHHAGCGSQRSSQRAACPRASPWSTACTR